MVLPQGDPPAVASEATAWAQESRHARSSSPPPNVTLNDFELLDRFSGRSLGKGSFGLVRMVRLKGTDNVFALKESAKTEAMNGNLQAQVERELYNHHSLKHRNIVRLYNYMQDEKFVYMLLEFCAKGELYQLLRTQKNRRFDEAMSRHFFTQLVDGLQYLHSQNIIHRDLKPENLLVDADDVLKIADFGWCVRVERAEPVQRRFTFCGTMDYLAPEMLQQSGHDHTLDIWACGILLYEMMVGRPPFQTSNYPVLISRILTVALSFPAWMPEGVKDLVKKLMKQEPRHRLPLDQVLRHPWVRGLEYSEQTLVQPIDSRQSQGSTTIPSESPHGTSTGRTLDSRSVDSRYSPNSTLHPVDSQQSQASTQPVDTRQSQHSMYFPCAARAAGGQQVPFATPTQSNRAVYVQNQPPPSYGQPVQRPMQIVHMMPFPQQGYPVQRHVRAQEPRTWGGPVYRPA